MQPPSAEDVKRWLKASGLSYQWLASKLGVGYGTVAQWLRPNDATKIPPPELHSIARLMHPDEGGDGELSAEELAQLQELARERGMGLIQLCVTLLKQQLALAADPEQAPGQSPEESPEEPPTQPEP